MQSHNFKMSTGMIGAAIILSFLALWPAVARVAAQEEKNRNGSSPPRLFELLEYEARDGKFEELVERFGQEIKLIEKHGAKVVGCWKQSERGTTTTVTTTETTTTTTIDGVTTTKHSNSSSSGSNSNSNSNSNHDEGSVFCLLAFADKDARAAFWDAIEDDADSVVLNRSDGRKLWGDRESELLVPTDYSPHLEDGAMNDLERLQGNWAAVAAEDEGDRAPRDEVKAAGIRFTVDGEKFALAVGDRQIMDGKLALGTGESPKIVDLSGRAFNDKAVELQGIYELERDTLKVCYAKTRPRQFKTSDDRALEERMYVFEPVTDNTHR